MDPENEDYSSVPQAKNPIEHKPSRIFSDFPNTRYCIPSDPTEKQRLDLQHKVLKEGLGNKLLLAPVLLKDGDNVLDSGAGSGAWLLDLATSVPASVNLQAVDIEGRIFPAQESRPHNLDFKIASIVSLPKEWSNKFKLIHQRLLVSGLQRAEWPGAIKEMHRTLKQGGWVQLCEIKSYKSGPNTELLFKIVLALGEHRGLFQYCAKYIPKMLKDNNFENIHTEDFATPLGKWAGQPGIDGSANFISLWRASKTPVLNAGGFGLVDSEERYDQLMDDLEREWDEIPGSETRWSITYAQKKLHYGKRHNVKALLRRGRARFAMGSVDKAVHGPGEDVETKYLVHNTDLRGLRPMNEL